MKEVVFCGRLSGCLEEDCLCRPVLPNGMGGGKGGRSKKLWLFPVRIEKSYYLCSPNKSKYKVLIHLI